MITSKHKTEVAPRAGPAPRAAPSRPRRGLPPGAALLLVALGLVGAAGQAPPTKEVEALAAEAAAG